jgi:UDP-glucuronate 4-epimerase
MPSTNPHQKILVTGGAGFIGSHLVDALLARGDEVMVIDNFNDFYNPEEKRSNLEKHLDNPNFQLHEIDICDAAQIRTAIELNTPEVLIHLAARAGVRPSIEEPLLYEETNIRGTMNLLEAVKNIGLKNFIFASSSSVYGNNEKVPFAEDDAVDHPISPYAATKKSGELICHSYHHIYNIPMTCLRFFTVYGPRQRPDLAIRKFMEKIERDEELTVFGNGSMERDFTYIDDIIQGLVHCIDNPFAYEIVNLGNSRPISVTNLVSSIEEALGKKARIKYEAQQPGDVDRTFADTTKAERLLGFKPDTPIEEGLAKMIEWLRNR